MLIVHDFSFFILFDDTLYSFLNFFHTLYLNFYYMLNSPHSFFFHAFWIFCYPAVKLYRNLKQINWQINVDNSITTGSEVSKRNKFHSRVAQVFFPSERHVYSSVHLRRQKDVHSTFVHEHLGSWWTIWDWRVNRSLGGGRGCNVGGPITIQNQISGKITSFCEKQCCIFWT